MLNEVHPSHHPHEVHQQTHVLAKTNGTYKGITPLLWRNLKSPFRNRGNKKKGEED
jgi:hypothetical protein